MEKTDMRTKTKAVSPMGTLRCTAALVLALGMSSHASHGQSPVEASELLAARSFTLSEGYRNDWRRERPWVTTGYVVVLRVHAPLVRTHATANRVLFADSGPVEILNLPDESGLVLGLVSGPIDLTGARFWFGAWACPSEIDAAAIEDEWAAAVAAEIEPFSAEAVQAALAAGGGELSVADRAALLAAMIPLMESFELRSP